MYQFDIVFLRLFSLQIGVISFSEVQLSGLIQLYHVTIVIFDIVFQGFHILFFCVFIENTNDGIFQVNNQNPRLKFRFWVYKLIAEFRKLTWENWIKSMGCNAIVFAHADVTQPVGPPY